MRNWRFKKLTKRFRYLKWIYENSDRPLEHTPDMDKNPIWKDSLHKQVVQGPGYVPGVCWNLLQNGGLRENPAKTQTFSLPFHSMLFGNQPNDLANHSTFTPPKTNLEPENHPIEKENHLPSLHFWVPCWFSGEYPNCIQCQGLRGVRHFIRIWDWKLPHSGQCLPPKN